MFILCIGYVSYSVLPWIPLHWVTADIDNNGHPLPPLVHYNEGLLLNILSHEGNVLSITMSFITMCINIAPTFLDITFKNHSRVYPKHWNLTHNYFLKIFLPPITKALKVCHWRNEKYERLHIPKLKSFGVHKHSETINRRKVSCYVG
jgi:hypothetical protein